jgi:hypothetical protein
MSTNSLDVFGPALHADPLDAEYGPALHPDVAADLERKRSVVKNVYKRKYAERAKAAGLANKVAQRSTWDWLAQNLAGECNGTDGKLDIGAFERILELNGVDFSRWTNRSKGWEGRFRMTGRLALQRVVAAAGVLVVEGDEIEAPAEWVAKFRN